MLDVSAIKESVDTNDGDGIIERGTFMPDVSVNEQNVDTSDGQGVRQVEPSDAFRDRSTTCEQRNINNDPDITPVNSSMPDVSAILLSVDTNDGSKTKLRKEDLGGVPIHRGNYGSEEGWNPRYRNRYA